MSPAIEMRGVVKRFGKTVALDGLDMLVPRGSITGIIGPNGAGKTTAMSILAGFLLADRGTISMFGDGPFDPVRDRRRVGILPQDAELPLASTTRQLLLAYARLAGLGAASNDAVRRALAAVQLEDRAGDRIATLSHGMRRRVSVATAFLGEPELVMLDEPTSGLDPAQAKFLRDGIAALRGRHTLVVSSHNLSELESLCDYAVFIAKGKCERQGTMASITRTDRHATIRLAAPFPAGRAELCEISLAPDDVRSIEDAITETLRELIAEGALIADVRRGSSLEHAFFE
jgi:ABC-2 type transport system ATP-binding protein